ncbi:MAG: Maf family protein [Anaerovoracaceae bacterium]|jgi:septum formation protein
MAEIILASASPRRIDMFLTRGFIARVSPSHVEESLPFPLTHRESVMYLALKKAMATKESLTKAETLTGREIIVGADTTVISRKGTMLGKPADKEEALAALLSMRDTYHFVMTGVAIIGNTSSLCFYETTKVFFSHYSREDLLPYLDTDEPYDKAGGYAIQGTFEKYVSRIEGDKNNVIGFPMTRFQQELQSFLPLDG